METRPALVVAGLVSASAAVRAGLASRMPTPWIFVDELVHADLARSVEAGSGFLVRGHHVTVSFVYPALIAPAWAAHSAATAYALAKSINAVAMSLAAVPVYLWGRRFLTVQGAVVAAALTLFLPVFVLTGTLMTENVFLPAFLLALFALGVALERPTLTRQAFVFAAVAFAVATRVQGLVLVPIVATAAVALGARRLWPLGVAFLGAGAAYVIAKAAAGESIFALGVYAGVRSARYSAATEAKFLAYSAGELALALAVVPLCALVALLPRLRRADRAERAFLAVAASAFAWSVVLGTVASAWEPFGVKERYMIHAAPLALLALVLWVERGAPRNRAAWAGAAVLVVLVAVLPLPTLFGEPSLLGNGFGLIPFDRLAHALGSVGAVRAVVAVGALAAAALFLFAPPRLLPLGVGAFLLASSVPVFTTYRGESRRLEAYGSSWVDDAVGRDAHVVYLNTANFEPETLQGRVVETFQPVWETEIWNRSFSGLVSLGLQEPAPLPQGSTTVDWATGHVVGVRARYVLARARFRIVGQLLARHGELELFRTNGPVRLASAIEGVDADGWANGHGALSAWTAGRAVRVSVSAGPGVVFVGTLEARPGGGAQIARRTAKVAFGAAGVAVTVRPPRPPYRIDIYFPDRSARVGFHVA